MKIKAKRACLQLVQLPKESFTFKHVRDEEEGSKRQSCLLLGEQGQQRFNLKGQLNFLNHTWPGPERSWLKSGNTNFMPLQTRV